LNSWAHTLPLKTYGGGITYQGECLIHNPPPKKNMDRPSHFYRDPGPPLEDNITNKSAALEARALFYYCLRNGNCFAEVRKEILDESTIHLLSFLQGHGIIRPGLLLYRQQVARKFDRLVRKSGEIEGGTPVSRYSRPRCVYCRGKFPSWPDAHAHEQTCEQRPKQRGARGEYKKRLRSSPEPEPQRW